MSQHAELPEISKPAERKSSGKTDLLEALEKNEQNHKQLKNTNTEAKVGDKKILYKEDENRAEGEESSDSEKEKEEKDNMSFKELATPTKNPDVNAQKVFKDFSNPNF